MADTKSDGSSGFAQDASARLPLALERTEGGDLAELSAGDLSLLLYPSTALESGPAGVWLRVGGEGEVRQARRLTGPASGARLDEGGAVVTEGGGVRARARADLSEDGTLWAWTWEVSNVGDGPVEVDLLGTLDAALTPRPDIERNEQYVSQYLDLTPVPLTAGPEDEAGGSPAIGIRQNMPGARQPWTVLVSDQEVAQWGTDALQLLDPEHGEGIDPSRDLPSERLQHEHTLAALRTAPQSLAPGESWTGRFWGFALADHPAATGPQDAGVIAAAAEALSGISPLGAATAVEQVAGEQSDGGPIAASLFAAARPLAVREATAAEREALVGSSARLVESEGEEVLSLFGENGHLVTAAKERAVLRPHGHIQQVVGSAAADASAVTTTSWMRGVFASQLTAGHASAAPSLSIRRSYLGLLRGAGVRILAREGGGADGAGGADGTLSLLSVPSLWRQDETAAEWVYLLEDGPEEGAIRIHAEPGLDGRVRIRVDVDGSTPELLVAVFDGTERAQLRVAASGGADLPLRDNGPLFADGASRGLDVRTAVLPAGTSAEITVAAPGARRRVGSGENLAAVGPDGVGPVAVAPDRAEPAPTEHPAAAEPYAPRLPQLRLHQDGDAQAQALAESLRWLAHDASIHFRSPRGLEQYTGGAWGTRDVCQGPLGLLIATDEPAAMRETILAIFAAQQDGGDWPQWFDYLPDHVGPGHRDSHGDVVYWPLRALGDYLAVTGDVSVLEEELPWIGAEQVLAPTPLRDHVERAIAHLRSQRTDDPRLPAYGHGDWNDSLQPAHAHLARQLCSTWTTELEISSLRILAEGLESAGAASAESLVESCRQTADAAEEALRELLLVDGELAGYGVITGDEVSLMVHPRDESIRHGSLQMIHAIGDELLTAEEAHEHLRLIEQELWGPAGIYLFDAPIEYRGGVMERFQRAEAATFWGREIGLMYMHSHIRWIEALSRLGETERMWQAIGQALQIGITGRIPGAAARQVTAYASSSDTAFADRAEASARAEEMFDPQMRVEGGWRVYSSGPGLLLRLLVEEVLGIRRRADRLELDPVLPVALDGAEARVPYRDGELTVRFTRGPSGCGVGSVRIDGREVSGELLQRRYRSAGISLAAADVAAGSTVEITTL